MKSIIPIVFLLSIVALGCQDSSTENENIQQVTHLRLENDSLKNELRIKKSQMVLEINMIVTHAKEAGDYYKKVLNAEIISQTDNEIGMNETMMKLGGVDVRVLDENKDYGMIAPAQVGGAPVGINLFVNDIDAFVANAVQEGCKIISPVQEFPEIPAKNAVFSDKFNHVWVVNQQY